MKRLIRLTENDLKQVIKESVRNILKEFDYNPSASDFDDVPTADEYDNFDKYHKFIKPYKDPYNDIDSYGGSGIIGNDDELNLDLESRKLGKIVKESIKKVLKESEYDPFDSGNAIVCSVSRKALTYGKPSKASLYGPGIYLAVGNDIPDHYKEYSAARGDEIIQVYVDASGFAHPSSPKEAMEIGRSGQVPGMIFTTRHDGEVCVVFDQSRIISRV